MPLTPQDFAATQEMGSSMNHVAMSVARMKYMQAVQQQRQALMLGQLALRKHMDETREKEMQAHIASYGERATADKKHGELYDSQAAINKEKLNSAMALGSASRMPIDMSEGPTIGAADQMRSNDLLDSALRSLALSGKANELFRPHSTPANAVSTDFFGGKTFGPRNTAPGYEYQAEPGAQTFQAPNRPLSPERRGNIDAALIGGLINDKIDDKNSDLYKAATNALARVTGNNLSVSGDQKPPQGSNRKQDALDAIKKGANPEAVKKRYKDLTGEDL